MGVLRVSCLSFGEGELGNSRVGLEEMPSPLHEIIGCNFPCIFFHVSILSRELDEYDAKVNQPTIERKSLTELREQDALLLMRLLLPPPRLA